MHFFKIYSLFITIILCFTQRVWSNNFVPWNDQDSKELNYALKQKKTIPYSHCALTSLMPLIPLSDLYVGAPLASYVKHVAVDLTGLGLVLWGQNQKELSSTFQQNRITNVGVTLNTLGLIILVVNRLLVYNDSIQTIEDQLSNDSYFLTYRF